MNTDFQFDIDCIIVGPDHYNTLNVLRSVSLYGFRAYIVLISSSRRNIVTASKYAKNGQKKNSYSDIPFVLLNIGQELKNKIPIISTNDRTAAVIDRYYNELSYYFFLPNCNSETGKLVSEMDKGRQVLLAEKHGFKVPQSISVELSKYDIISSELRYPCIVKPIISIDGKKSDMKICDNFEQLQIHLNSIRKYFEKCQIQRFIPNDKFFLVGGVRLPNGETIIPGMIEKFKFGHRNHTLGLNAFGKIDRINTHIKNKCTAYLNDINYHGPFSFELVYSKHDCINEDNLFFIELNLRTDGLFYFYDAANSSLASIWVSYFKNNKVLNCDLDIKNHIYGMSETVYISEFFTLNHILPAIKDIRKSQAFCYYNKRDIRPFLAKFFKFY